MINILLKQLDFNDKETTVYLAILKQGKILPTDLAKQTGINRSTVYSISKELLQKGLITEELGSSKRYLVALPPSELQELVKADKQVLRDKQAKVNSAIQALQELSIKSEYHPPKITFIEEQQIKRFLCKNAQKWVDSTMEHDGVWWGFQDHQFVEHHHEWIDWFWKNWMKNRRGRMLHVRLLSNRSDIETDMGKKHYTYRQIRFWKHDQFTSTIWICGDYLIMLNNQEKPFHLLEIRDKQLAQNLRFMFRGMWGSP